MFPEIKDILLYILLGIVIHFSGLFVGKINKKLGYVMEVIAAVLVIALSVYQYPFPDFLLFIGFISSGYIASIMITAGWDKYKDLKEEMSGISTEEIHLKKDHKRILIDFLLSAIILSGAILFLIYGPDTSPLKIFLVFGLVTMSEEMIKRYLNFRSVRVFFVHESDTLYILSWTESKKLPLVDMKDIRVESSTDILKLHPMLTLFSSNSDFTTSVQETLRLSFPGNSIYLTIEETWKWKSILRKVSSSSCSFASGRKCFAFLP